MSDATPSRSRQQVEAARFRSAVSEALLQGMQGNINFLLSSILPVGSSIDSMLSEAQFQDEIGSTDWVLADGRSASGSNYELLTGNSTIPDLRGVFVRGKNNGRAGGSGNPDGETALGTYQADQVIAHVHGEHYRIPNAASGGSDGGGDNNRALTDVNEDTTSVGGNETRPRNVTMNKFFRIN